MSMITGVHHIAVRATDFDRTMQFYSGTLGLAVKATWTRHTGRAAFVEIAPGSYMEIFEREPMAHSGTAPILHFCLRASDVDALTERVRADGYRVTVEPVDVAVEADIGRIRLRLSFIEGPEGEEIELMSSDVV